MSDRHLVAAHVWNGIPGQGRLYHLSNVPEGEREHRYGRGEVVLPNTIVAGNTVDVLFRFTIGEMELGLGAALRVAWRWPFDWADPNHDQPNIPGYVSLTGPDHTKLNALYEPRGNLDPWYHDIDMRVTEGVLTKGDIVELRITRWGAPTFATTDGAFVFAVSPSGGNDWYRLVDAPRFAIHPGQPEHLHVVVPSDGFIDEQTVARVRAVDRWENATTIEPPDLSCAGAEVDVPRLCKRYPVWEYPIRWTKPGIHRLIVTQDDLIAESNPSHISSEPPAKRLFWGDLHGGQSEIGCGQGSLDHHYAFARDVAGLQFTSQQANDHYVSRVIWEHVRKVTPQYNVDGSFLAYLGCEWSPPTEDGGDRNVIYLQDEPRMRRSGRFFAETNPDPEPDLPRAPEFLDAFRDEHVLLNLHVGGRPTNLDWHAQEIEPLFEVHSTHATSEWFFFDALRRGYKVGVTAGTDGVMGRPGACGPGRRVTRNVRNGLTAVTADRLEQQSVANAFLARRCYGTTGARILLDVDVDGHSMGASVSLSSAPKVTLQIEGTAPIEQVDLFRGTEIIHTWRTAEPDPHWLRVLWGGANKRGTAGAQRQLWEGTLRIEDGTIDEVKPIGFQCPLDRISVDEGEATITWSAATAGNDMGFAFLSNGDGVLSIETNLVNIEVPFECGRRKTTIADAGGLNRRLEIGPAPAANTFRSLELTHTDDAPLADEQPYWVRVTQVDRHRAWSSPIYVTMT